VSEKTTLLIAIFLAAGLMIIHFWKPATAASSSTVSFQPAQLKRQIQPASVAFPAGLEPVAAPAPEISVTPARTKGDDLIARLEARLQLMARLRDWAATDFSAALAFASQLPDDERDDALQAVCFGLAQKDHARAVTVAQTLQEPEAVMENLVQQWSGSDLPSALAWVNNQPAGNQRDEMTQRVALIWAQSDPVDAANLVLNQIPPGSAQDEAIMTVLNQWANKDLKSAALWVQNFPDTPLGERALAEVEGIEKYQQELAQQ